MGLTLAAGLVPILRTAAAPALPPGVAVSIHPADFALGMGLALGAALTFGVVPAWLGATAGLAGPLGAGSRLTWSRGVRLFRGALVAGQVGVAVVVLIAAGLMIRSVQLVFDEPLGFDARDLTVASLTLPEDGPDPVAVRAAFVDRFEDELRQRLGAVPLVMASSFPFGSAVLYSASYGVVPSGDAELRTRPVNAVNVSPDCFQFLGVPVIRGRAFSAAEVAANADVVIVNETFVADVAGGAEILGKLIQRRGQAPATVVGVVGDTRGIRLGYAPQSRVFRPLTPVSARGAVRAPDSAMAARAIRDAVMVVDPDVPVVVRTAAEDIRRGEATRAFYLAMLTTFAAIATVLAAAGIFGVVAHVTGLRVREFGIRLALGARSAQLDARVVRDALVPVTVGLVAGLGVAWWLGGLLTANSVFMAQLYAITPRDPATLGAVLASLLVVAAVAAWVPARRATRVDPAQVLRAE